MSALQKLTIHFETSVQLPPPYSYQYVLTLTPSSTFLHANLQLTYTHRDELETDEIEAEGFSENDDYQWEGHLTQVWSDELEKLILKTKLEENQLQEEDADFLSLEIQTHEVRRG